MSSRNVLVGDCIEVMRGMPDASVDAIVTDPPYGLGFMGKAWDELPPGPEFAAEALRVLKPGGHLLAFGGTRTFHRLVVALEDAGFEIRDTIAWLYGSGFPKSLDVSKAIDKAAGAEREVIGTKKSGGASALTGNNADAGPTRDAWREGGGFEPGLAPITAPATDEARAWDGWGTALKPAHEPIVVARKPLTGTVAANVLQHGTGAINVDACRIGVTDAAYARNHSGDRGHAGTRGQDGEGATNTHAGGGSASSEGRWPANVVLDEEAAAVLDAQTGTLKSNSGTSFKRNPDENRAAYGQFEGNEAPGYYGDSGGASRFFYCAKASRKEREAGLDGLERRATQPYNERPSGGLNAHLHGSDPAPRSNTHPTVKPVALMRWLVRMVTPPGGTVLDPFLGSGTTGVAAALEGVDFVGVEREAEYAEIARARIAHAYWNEGDAAA